LVFLPNILFLFFSIAILEDSGYMARAAFVMDGVMRKFGLQGRSFVPLVLGFGCSVPGIMATRTIESERDRKVTIMVLPLMSCGARLPIYALIIPAFFAAKYRAGMMLLIYLIGVVIALVAAFIMKSTLFSGDGEVYLMELPPYHKPRLKPLFFMALRRYKHIAWRAFKVILIVAIAFWLLTYSPTGLIENSVIGSIGLALDPVTQFFGMGWRTFVAFLGSILAKEAMVGVLAAVYASADPSLLAAASGTTASAFSLSSLVTQVSGPEALAFMFAVAFNVPCVMTLGATYSETHSLKWTVAIALFYVAMALVISFVVFHIAGLFMV